MKKARLVPARRRHFLFGLDAEWRAAWWLRLQGYRIVQRRFLGGGGEIDLIARRGRLMIFVEVKARAALDDAVLAITPDKMRRIGRAARAFMARYPMPDDTTLRLDAISVAPGHVPRHTRNIAPFEPG